MPKLALSEVVKGGAGFLKELKCFVGSEKVLSGEERGILERNIDILRKCVGQIPEDSQALKGDIDSIVFVDKYQFLHRGIGSKEGAYALAGQKVAIIDFMQENLLNFLYSFFSALEELTHQSNIDIYDKSENRNEFVRLLELQKFNTKLKVDKVMKAFFLGEIAEPGSEASFGKYWESFKNSSDYNKYDGIYRFIEISSSSAEEECKEGGFELGVEIELVGDDSPVVEGL